MAFPGQPGNLVGYAGGSYSGSLTTVVTNSITASASNTRFDGGTLPISITGTNLTFTNCYFGVSTNAANGQPWFTYPSGGGHTFNFCTFGPSPNVVGGSFPPMPPSGGGYSTWPSQPGNEDSVGIAYVYGNQYGVIGYGLPPPPGGLNFQNCDGWGFSNGLFLWSQTNASNPITINNCWIHDPCLAPPGAHTDMLGDVQSQNGDYCIGTTITNNTFGGVSSEALAIQLNGPTQPSDFIMSHFTFSGNYLDVAASWVIYSGAIDAATPATYYAFTNNTFNATFPPLYGICGDGAYGTILAPSFPKTGSTNTWFGNKVLPGVYGNGVNPDTGQPTGNIQLTVTLANQFLWPDMTANSTDWETGPGPSTYSSTMSAVATLTAKPQIPVHATFSALGALKAAASIPAIEHATFSAAATFTANETMGYPGQASNPVGYAAAPGYAGLTVFSGTLTSGTAGAHKVYQYLDFQNGTTPLTISSLSYVDFIGCRFQSNAVSAWPAAESSSNVIVTGSSNNITFHYCSFTPLTSIATVTPGGPAWPCVGTGTNTNNQIPGTNSLSETQGYTYGLLIDNITGPLLVDHCDFWGFGNIAIFFSGTTAPITVSESWLHDMLAEGPLYQQHQDIIGFLLDQVNGVQNVTIENCTLASMGSDNAVAFQGNTDVLTTYANISVTGCYITGCGYTITLPGGVERFNPGVTTITGTLNFYNNVVSTEIPWIFGPLYAYYQTNFTTGTWFNNIIKVLPGGTPLASSSGDFPDWNYTYANNGNYLWPDSTFATTDWPGNSSQIVVSATMSAGTSFSATAKAFVKAAATLPVAASFSATPQLSVYGAAALPAVASFTAVPLAPSVAASATLSASTALSVVGKIPFANASAVLGATTVFSANPLINNTVVASATLTSTTALTAIGSPLAPVYPTAVLGATASLSAAPHGAFVVSAALSAAASLTAAPLTAALITATMSGLGLFSSTGQTPINVAAAMASLGSFSTIGLPTVYFAWDTQGLGWDAGLWEIAYDPAMFAAASFTLSGGAPTSFEATAMAVTGKLTASAAQAVESAATFAGAGTLSVSGRGADLVTASLAATTALTVSGDLPSYVAKAALAATGAFVATLPGTVQASASFAATGALTGVSTSATLSTSAFSSTSLLSVQFTPPPTVSGSAAFAATSALTGVSTSAYVTTAAFNGTGGFSLTSIPPVFDSATFGATSTLVATGTAAVEAVTALASATTFTLAAGIAAVEDSAKLSASAGFSLLGGTPTINVTAYLLSVSSFSTNLSNLTGYAVLLEDGSGLWTWDNGTVIEWSGGTAEESLTLSATGAFSATGLPATEAALGTLTIASAFSATGLPATEGKLGAFPVLGSFALSGYLTAVESVAAFSALATLTGAGTRAHVVSATFPGASQFSLTPIPSATSSAAFSALGAFAGVSTSAYVTTVTFPGATQLTLGYVPPPLPVQEAAAFVGSSLLTAVSVSATLPTATLLGTSLFALLGNPPAVSGAEFIAASSLFTSLGFPADLVDATFSATTVADFEFLGPPINESATFGALSEFTIFAQQLLPKRDPFLIINW